MADTDELASSGAPPSGTDDGANDTESPADATGDAVPCSPESVRSTWIWARDDIDDTIVKVDTDRAEIIARYAGPTSRDDAKNGRIGVSANGDAAYVYDGVAVVWRGDTKHCNESNDEPGTQTSAGPDDVLPWGADECVAWSATVDPDSEYRRAIAWEHGSWSQETCRFEGAALWTTGNTAPPSSDFKEGLLRVDGETGEVLLSVPTFVRTGFQSGLQVAGDGGVFFVSPPHDPGSMDFVAPGATEVMTIAYPYYLTPTVPDFTTLAIDRHGIPWHGRDADFARLNQATDQYESIQVLEEFQNMTGTAIDLSGLIWIADTPHGGAGPTTLWTLDPVALKLEQVATLNDAGGSLAIDQVGRVWTLGEAGLQRYDPVSGDIVAVTGVSARQGEVASATPLEVTRL